MISDTLARLIIAIRYGDASGVQVCLDYGAAASGLFWELVELDASKVRTSCIGVVDSLEFSRTVAPTTPLNELCQLAEDRPDIARKLFFAGANPTEQLICSIKCANEFPSSHIKDYYSYEHYLETINQWYANIHVRSRDLRPVVHQAISSGKIGVVTEFFSRCSQEEVTKLLYRPGGAPKNSPGILDIALEYPEMVKLCLKRGADPFRDFITPMCFITSFEEQRSCKLIARARMVQWFRRLFAKKQLLSPKLVDTNDGPCILGRLELKLVGKKISPVLEHNGLHLKVSVPESISIRFNSASRLGEAKARYTLQGLEIVEVEVDGKFIRGSF